MLRFVSNFKHCLTFVDFSTFVVFDTFPYKPLQTLYINLSRSTGIYGHFCQYPKSVHRPAKVSWCMTIGLTTPKSVHRPAKVSWFVDILIQ